MHTLVPEYRTGYLYKTYRLAILIIMALLIFGIVFDVSNISNADRTKVILVVVAIYMFMETYYPSITIEVIENKQT